MDPELPADRPLRPLSDEVFGAAPPAGRFGFKRRQLPSSEIVAATDSLQRRLQAQRQANRIRRRWYLSIAAALGLLVGAFVYRPLYEGLTTVQHATAFNETQTITLPDGSTVILNANSRLQYPRHWVDERPREVWLTGEAYFSVEKIPTRANQNFVVHTDGLAIEVLGTTFNVNQRDSTTAVVLTSGKVKLHRDGVPQADVVMQPGERVVYTPRTEQIAQESTNPSVHIAWKDNLLIFEDQSLSDIAGTIEDRYGITLRFATPAIAQQRFTASLPADRIEVFFTMLASSYTVQRTASTVLIHEKNP